jgi:outer membrane protein assembly factor BamB
MSGAAIRPRWWPAIVLTCVWLAILGVSRFWPDLDGQVRVLAGLLVTVAWMVLMLLWLVALSRLPWRARAGSLLGVVAACGLFVALFRYAGVTGDVLPIFEPRWRSRTVVEHVAPHAPLPEAAALVEPSPEPTGEQSADSEVDAGDAPAGAALSRGEAMLPEGDSVAGSDDVGASDGPLTPRLAEPPAPPSSAPDFPQFLGPSRDGRIAVSLDPDWSSHPPRELWRRPVGAGWSGFAIHAGRAVTLERHDDQDRVRAYELATGTMLWEQPVGASFASALAGDGPRSTPTIDGGVVFVYSSLGVLAAADLASGGLLWSRDTKADTGASPPEWGYAGSPLVLGDRVLVVPGGTNGFVVAYDRRSGELVARAGSEAAAYSSPFLATLGGTELVVSFNGRSVTGHDPATLEERFRHPWSSAQPNVAQPLPLPGDRLLVSAGYGVGAEMVRVQSAPAGLTVELLWKSPRLKAKFTNVVLHEGLVYGLDDGVLVCLDPETGERRWRQGRYGHGQVLLAGDLLLVQTEHGEIVLVDPDPAGLRELARHEVLDGKAWNAPALAPPFLLVRNHREAVAFELALATP